MYCGTDSRFSGLSALQCAQLVEQYHIYVPSTGRLSVAGLNKGNLDYVARAIDHVVRAY
jgi:aspartate/tyrosine/aromatic aminotransferase